ncbi:MAG TPA: aminotransferase class V-fold PLP-dependent enzyme, partial [Candidatus Marinimicrobia bacterium]|nr:aminotransferase class V-fold PLP-dependent enzyme [Candidatus Neomarinimicrobiota bacterium]
NNKLPGLVCVSFPGYRSDILMAKLDRAKLAVSSGSACGSGNVKPSRVLSEMGVDDEINISTLRFSFGASNTSEQVGLLLSKLKTILTD